MLKFEEIFDKSGILGIRLKDSLILGSEEGKDLELNQNPLMEKIWSDGEEIWTACTGWRADGQDIVKKARAEAGRLEKRGWLSYREIRRLIATYLHEKTQEKMRRSYPVRIILAGKSGDERCLSIIDELGGYVPEDPTQGKLFAEGRKKGELYGFLHECSESVEMDFDESYLSNYNLKVL